MTHPGCILCRGAAADAELGREQVWEDDLWRLSTAVESEVAGFSYLEPKRHIPHITDLDGEEAVTFGPVVAKVTRALRDAAGAEVVYIYVFGEGVPHMHLHLAPHVEGDALSAQMTKGEVIEDKQPSGVTFIINKDYPLRPPEEIRGVIETTRATLRGMTPSRGSASRERARPT